MFDGSRLQNLSQFASSYSSDTHRRRNRQTPRPAKIANLPDPKLLTLDLQGFLDLPVDVVYQILRNIDAEDALLLLKVPSLRDLVCPSSSQIATPLWRHWIRVEGAPECPEGINILRWGDILFGEHICDTCDDLNTPPEPRLLRRICRACLSNPDLVINFPYDSSPPRSPKSTSAAIHRPPPEHLVLGVDMSELCLGLNPYRFPAAPRARRTEPLSVTYLASEWFGVREKLLQLTAPIDGDHPMEVMEERLGLIEQAKDRKQKVAKYVERRKRLVTTICQKEDDLKRWIAEYPGLRKPSWVAAQKAMSADITSRYLARGFTEDKIEYALSRLYFTPTLRHYDVSVFKSVWLEMETYVNERFAARR